MDPTKGEPKKVEEKKQKFISKLLVPDKKKKYFQSIPEVTKAEQPKVEVATSSGQLAPVAPLPAGCSMFPDTMVMYKDDHRDFIISTDYDETLIRPLPLFYVAIGFKGGEEGENAIVPVVLHRGYDKTYPIYGYVTSIERHAKGTICNHAYNPSAPFATTILDISAHFTQEFCTFNFLVPNFEGGAPISQRFKWKQAKGSEEVVVLAKERAIPTHDWSWIDRKWDRGMKLVREDTGEVLAVYKAGKNHSKLNPLKIVAKVRWLESATWTDELKLAAFLALMCYAENRRRSETGCRNM